ncbi:putative farnesyl-diphosphate farnesyltransferase [Saitoella complicata NRRL Y-17804]|uniref:Squalene synthase n=1 Tax=Saitoella complicata (strain BCRC 22490 / CBS 7301 / JCM 7358 / NBRC 10748 / NRRL Y-17804) TaxID=698492 RepID=A0A0E9NHJ4_SAICN|nr:putative farnesyl-diphosphate farnesyltransferase [Saitoella complicata NRRL Y-17804]ODQ51244.1 putative farnesyl-diphosphate farnesyltransferase [Saitoella complicata NRRL Y-17804]GAO49309.1 hypothetical protein G7K_3460-t1 [Saitoella complicata NRRL Y-17804]
MGYLELLLRPSELRAITQYKTWHQPLHARDPTTESPNRVRCYELLELTSRSFSAVIQELQPELREPVMLFYLVLRGLDTIEDDMTIPMEKKEPLLREFDGILEKKGWTFTENGPNEKDRQLLVEFDVVIEEFLAIKPNYQEVIKDITSKMGNGMADYAKNASHNINGVQTVEDYDLYCHYVAGLVGEGLSRLFGTSGIEDPRYADLTDLSNSMGLFLQKTNIIRDFREDLDDKRRFWPKEIWSKYCADLSEFADPANEAAALNCISEMTLDALRHATDCLLYLSGLRDQSVFNFCAIPQVMAISTLALVFRNRDVFHRNVKIRKGQACAMIMKAKNLRSVCDIFLDYTREIHRKNTPSDPNFLAISIACGKIEQWTETVFPSQKRLMLQKAEDARKRANELEAAGRNPDGGVSDATRMAIFVILFWVGVTVLMTGVATLFGARFDLAFKRIWEMKWPSAEELAANAEKVGKVVGSATETITRTATVVSETTVVREL